MLKNLAEFLKIENTSDLFQKISCKYLTESSITAYRLQQSIEKASTSLDSKTSAASIQCSSSPKSKEETKTSSEDVATLLQEKMLSAPKSFSPPTNSAWPFSRPWRTKPNWQGKEISKPSVILVHPYIFCSNDSTHTEISPNRIEMVKEVNKLAWAAKELGYNFFSISHCNDRLIGISTKNFPIAPTACFEGGYTPPHQKLATNHFIFMGGYYGRCLTQATEEIIESYFDRSHYLQENGKIAPLNIYYPLKTILIFGPGLTVDRVAKDMKEWWDNGYRHAKPFKSSPHSIQPWENSKETKLVIHTPSGVETYGDSELEIHFHIF